MNMNNWVRTGRGGALVAAGLWAGVLGLAVQARGQAAGPGPSLPYLGQTPPGLTPAAFAPGIVSTPAHEFGCSFTPDGNEFYFTRRETPQSPMRIMVSRFTGGAWTTPQAAPFNDPSARMSFEPLATPDGRRLFFSSDRPLAGQSGQGGPLMMNVWYVERNGERWSAPREAGAPFNPMRTMYVSMTRTGTIYTTDISGGMGTESVSVARFVDGKYTALEKLPAPINVGTGNMYPFVAPDESYLIFSSRRAAGTGASGLFVSFRNPDGTWGEPRAVDLGMPAGQASVSPDGQYLFFTGGERGRSDIYWVSARVLGQRPF